MVVEETTEVALSTLWGGVHFQVLQENESGKVANGYAGRERER